MEAHKIDRESRCSKVEHGPVYEWFVKSVDRKQRSRVLRSKNEILRDRCSRWGRTGKGNWKRERKREKITIGNPKE